MVMAADQFIITPAGRIADAARSHADGDEVRTVIAGCHWFTDWGRGTMINLSEPKDLCARPRRSFAIAQDDRVKLRMTAVKCSVTEH